MQSLGLSLGDDVADRRTKPDAPATRVDARGLTDAAGKIMLALIIYPYLLCFGRVAFFPIDKRHSRTSVRV
jgi:hypothetical protein